MNINDTKLAALLGTFTKKETDELDKFIASPFFNTSEQLKEFWLLLRSDLPSFKSLTKEKIYDVLYPGEEYKDKRIRDIFSRMLELCYEYLIQAELNNRNFLKKELLLKQMYDRELEVHFNGVKKDFEKLLSQTEIVDGTYLYSEYIKTHHVKEYVDIRSTGMDDLEAQMHQSEYDTFVDYVLYKISEYTLIFMIRNYSVKTEVNYRFSEYIYEFLKKNPQPKYPVFEILVKFLDLKKNEDKKYSEKDKEEYLKLRELIEKNKRHISREMLVYFFVYLVNYSKLKTLGTNNFFYDEYYALLKYSFEHNVYPKAKYITNSSYKTVAKAAITRKDYGWALRFIEKYKSELNPEEADSVYFLCKANYFYRNGLYSDALKNLIIVPQTEIMEHCEVKFLQIKIHYELSDFEICSNLIDSFRHFMRTTEKMPEFIKVRFVNFINFTDRVVKVQLGGDKRNLINIKKELEEVPQGQMENGKWLLGQISKIQY